MFRFSPSFPLIALAALFLLNACASKSPYEGGDCFFPDSKEEKAPQWVCTEWLDDDYITSLGTSKVKQVMHFAEQQASLQAKQKLAQRISSKIESEVEQAISEETTEETEVIQYSRLSIKEIVDQNLTGTRILRKITSSQGMLYVLVGIDDNVFQALSSHALKQIISNKKQEN